jgi:hypothetical protein
MTKDIDHQVDAQGFVIKTFKNPSDMRECYAFAEDDVMTAKFFSLVPPPHQPTC